MDMLHTHGFVIIPGKIDHGFVIIADHGIPQPLIDRLLGQELAHAVALACAAGGLTPLGRLGDLFVFGGHAGTSPAVEA
jgi:hypothetical protein